MNKLEKYIWKDKRMSKDRSEQQVTYRLIDFGEIELNTAYDHCKHMLYNDDPKNPGRMRVLDEISKQLVNCNTELAHRWFLNLTDTDGNLLYSDANLITELRSWLATTNDPTLEYTLQDFVQVPPEFKLVPINQLINACRDSLDLFNHSKLTLSFLYNLGVYFTPKEYADLDARAQGNTLKEKVEILKVQLGLKDDVEIKVNPKGLTEQEFRDMIHLKKMKGFKTCKYSEMTTSQLTTLRNKVLYAFEQEVKRQAKTWQVLMSQIEEVAEYKDCKLY